MAEVTITKSLFDRSAWIKIGIVTLFNLSLLGELRAQDHLQFSNRKYKIQKTGGCTKESRARLKDDLTSFLRRPHSSQVIPMAERLCRSSLTGGSPCPIGVSQDKVALFYKALKQNDDVVAVLACTTPSAEGSIRQELNELQSQQLDRLGAQFFSHWMKIPSATRLWAQKLEDFVLLGPDSPIKKTRLYNNRLVALKGAPLTLRDETEPLIAQLSETVEDSRSIASEAAAAERQEISLRGSKFSEIIYDKLIRLKTNEREVVVATANQTLDNEGLNYRVYVKRNITQWSICATSDISFTGCRVAEMIIPLGNDECGPYSQFGVLTPRRDSWVILSDYTNYSVKPSDYFSPAGAVLRKGKSSVRSWSIPEGFELNYISKDLKKIYVKTIVKTEVGRVLAQLFLEIDDQEAPQFVDITALKKDLKPLTQQPVQKFPSRSKKPFELISHGAKNCPR